MTPHENMLITVEALKKRKKAKLKHEARKEYDARRYISEKIQRTERTEKWGF